jgi:hypothetical protein
MVVILHDGENRIKARLLCGSTVNVNGKEVLLEQHHVIQIRYVIRVWREFGADATADSPYMQAINILEFTPLCNPRRATGDVDPTRLPWAHSAVKVPGNHEILCAPYRVVRSWGEVPPGKRPPGIIECDGLGCSATTGEIITQCVVHYYPPPDYTTLIERCETVDDIYKGKNGKPEDMPVNHRRWVLYYYYATHVFGFVARTRLPLCVEAAVRATWPNPIGVAYTGFQP